MTAQTETKERIVCETCERLTWNQIIFSQEFQFMVYDGEAYLGDEKSTWQILQCLGCGSVTAREMADLKFGDNETHYERLYPKRTDHKVKFYVKLSGKMRRLYNETSDAFNSQNFILCAAGLRALLESVCLDKRITEGPNEHGQIVKTLDGKINSLSKIIPPEIVKNLHSFRFLGNQALHELEIPIESDLRIALDVIEDIMNVVYELNFKSKYLFQRTSKKKMRRRRD
ncbi:MAG: DUF4145 domain-containing protein [Anaerolineae bacterium]|nr:DUF4145 domain-containing protein [Anaerolineae bacterium]MBL8105814.1 DUF4145 domain-containing protein [Anaerolineales bacterium]